MNETRFPRTSKWYSVPSVGLATALLAISAFALGSGTRSSAASSALSLSRSPLRNPPLEAIAAIRELGSRTLLGERPALGPVPGGLDRGVSERLLGLGEPGVGPGPFARRLVERRLGLGDRRLVQLRSRRRGPRRLLDLRLRGGRRRGRGFGLDHLRDHRRGRGRGGRRGLGPRSELPGCQGEYRRQHQRGAGQDPAVGFRARGRSRAFEDGSSITSSPKGGWSDGRLRRPGSRSASRVLRAGTGSGRSSNSCRRRAGPGIGPSAR